jgi:peptidyl-dipeptidase Dcp
LENLETLFHEFGHALHAMLSESKYDALSGFNVEWDFVEFPSQIHEKWKKDPENLQNISKHYKTGEKISNEVVDTLNKLETFLS